MATYDPNYTGKWEGYFKILKVYFTDDEIKDYYGERMINDPEEYYHNPETDFIQKEEEELIQVAINQLQEPYQTAYTLFSQDGLPMEEIAEKMNIKQDDIGRLLEEAEGNILLFLKKNG